MTDEQEAKRSFVECELQEMLRKATGGVVSHLHYQLNDEGEEYVIVRWHPSARVGDSFLVNVTADSLWAIAKDVMKAVTVRY